MQDEKDRIKYEKRLIDDQIYFERLDAKQALENKIEDEKTKKMIDVAYALMTEEQRKTRNEAISELLKLLNDKKITVLDIIQYFRELRKNQLS